jgi:predicted Zn-dependent peptidase
MACRSIISIAIPDNIEKVTAAEIKAAFARHVRPEHLVTVVVAGE